MQVLPSDLESIKKYLAPPAEAAHIKPASTWVDSVVDAITNPSQESNGVPIQYLNYQDNLRFRLGEVTIWAGANGHGKSLILNQFVLWSMNDIKSLVISPEMPVAKTMQRMVYQATRQRHSNEQNIRAFT